MRQQRHMGKAVAVLSATAALLVFSCFLGQTQARYENYSQWRAVYTPRQQVLHSDRLVSGGQTILLNDWQPEKDISRMEAIAISSNTGAIKGTLRCVSDRPEYIVPSLDRTEITADAAGIQVQLIMTPTEAASQLTEKTRAVVRVEFLPQGETEPTHWAEYHVQLQNADENAVQSLQEGTPAVLNVESAESFAWAESLFVKVKTPSQADTLTFSMDGAEFPEGTRYIHNGKAFLLGDAMHITTAVNSEEEQNFLLDFSLLPQPQSGKISLQVQTLYQQTVTGTKEFSVTTTRAPLQMDLTEVHPVLTGSSALTIPLSSDTKGLVWHLEMLTETEEGIAYTQSDEQYYLVVTISANTQNMITISNENGKAPAGTYRLTLERLQDGQVISSRQMQFFVCY